MNQFMIPAELMIREALKKKLLSGKGVLLKHEDLTGPHKVLLTKKQHTKLNRARMMGKGMRLKLSDGSVEADEVGSDEFEYKPVRPVKPSQPMPKPIQDKLPNPIKPIIEPMPELELKPVRPVRGEGALKKVGKLSQKSGTGAGKAQNFRKGHVMTKKSANLSNGSVGSGFKPVGAY